MGNEFSEQQIQEHFVQLPKVLQDAITSADIEQHLRAVSDAHKLHLDEWSLLENQVMLTLMGLQRAEDLAQNIQNKVGVDATTAAALALDISRVVFDPVRAELERQLEHPNAPVKVESGVENMAAQVLSSEENAAPAPVAPTVTPVTAPAPAPLVPPPSAPETKSARVPLSETYKTGELSAARKDVHNDPYREPPA